MTLPEPVDDVVAYAVDGPPGLAALLAARGGIDGIEPGFLVSGINMGTNTGHSILHSGTVGAALTAATFGLSAALAVSLAVSKPMAWEAAYDHVAEALDLLDRAPRATVLNVNVPVPQGDGEPGPLRWAELDRFGSFRVAVAERRDAEVQLEYRARGSGHRLDPESDTALVDGGVATVTALDAIRAVPTRRAAVRRAAADPEPRLAPGPGEARPRGRSARLLALEPRLGLGEPLGGLLRRLARLARRRLRSVRLAVEATCLGPCLGDRLLRRLDAATVGPGLGLPRRGRATVGTPYGGAGHRLEPGCLDRLREGARGQELRLRGRPGAKGRRHVAQHGVGDLLPVVREQRLSRTGSGPRPRPGSAASASFLPALTALAACSSSRISAFRRRASWLTTQAASTGLRSAVTSAAASRSPSPRRRRASASRSRVNSSSGRP